MPRYKRAELSVDDSSVSNPNYADTIGFSNMYTSSSQLTMSPDNSSSGAPLDPAILSVSSPVEDIHPDRSPQVLFYGQSSSSTIALDPNSSTSPTSPTSKFGNGQSQPSVMINKGRSRRRTFWDRASPLERLLTISVTIITLFSFILLVLLIHGHSKSSKSTKHGEFFFPLVDSSSSNNN
jgi:hypothetical protein